MKVSLSKGFDVRCPNCNQVVSFSNRYDAEFCKVCNVWTEERCLYVNCEFCRGRPESPSEAMDLDEATLETEEAQLPPPSVSSQRFVIVVPKVSRNQPCPCGSSKKHKKCCLPRAACTPPPQKFEKETPRRGEHALSRFGRLFQGRHSQSQAETDYPRDNYGIPIIGSHLWRVWWLGFLDHQHQRNMRTLSEVRQYFEIGDLPLSDAEEAMIVIRYSEGYSRTVDRSHQINGPSAARQQGQQLRNGS